MLHVHGCQYDKQINVVFNSSAEHNPLNENRSAHLPHAIRNFLFRTDNPDKIPIGFHFDQSQLQHRLRKGTVGFYSMNQNVKYMCDFNRIRNNIFVATRSNLCFTDTDSASKSNRTRMSRNVLFLNFFFSFCLSSELIDRNRHISMNACWLAILISQNSDIFFGLEQSSCHSVVSCSAIMYFICPIFRMDEWTTCIWINYVQCVEVNVWRYRMGFERKRPETHRAWSPPIYVRIQYEWMRDIVRCQVITAIAVAISDVCVCNEKDTCARTPIRSR